MYLLDSVVISRVRKKITNFEGIVCNLVCVRLSYFSANFRKENILCEEELLM